MATWVSFRKRLGLIAAVVVLFGVACYADAQSVPVSRADPAGKLENFKQPTTLAELLVLKPEQLGSVDIALMNLLCAESLPGAENLDVNKGVTTLDQWAQDLKWQIDRNFHHYEEDPAYFYNSTNFFKMVMMASILYSQYNVRYNPDLIEPVTDTKISDDKFFADSRNAFINGLVGLERMGTCSSMPVLYVALGRRLGFPLKLVQAKAHLFLRWDGPTERFDMDATGKGVNKYDDEHYRKWPYPITDEDVKADGLLQSMTPAQELSYFLGTRSACLHAAGRIRDVIAAKAAAVKFEPNWRRNHWELRHAEREYTGTCLAELPYLELTATNPTEADLIDFERWKMLTSKRLATAENGGPEALPAYSKDPIP